MRSSLSPNRKLAIAGGIVLTVVAITCVFVWMKRPAAQLKAPSDELLEKLIAARPDQRDDLVLELGRRGPQVIPPVTAAYEKASNDPDLRTRLATVIFRTNAPAEAVPALELLLQKEKDPVVRDTIQSYLAGLRRTRGPGA